MEEISLNGGEGFQEGEGEFPKHIEASSSSSTVLISAHTSTNSLCRKN